MNQYTEFLLEKAETLSPDDDGYEESLIEIASMFRGFDEAFTTFIVEREYAGDSTDVYAKAQFLREKFKSVNVRPPRDFKDWFVPDRKIARKTAFQICFAFGLSVAQTNDFFKCVQFERGFDCHTISEAVYYFCIKNGISYSEAEEIIERIPVSEKVKTIANREVIYTGAIIEYIDSIAHKEQLIHYITANIEDFQYNNVTAIKYVQELWAEISKEDGLAIKEGLIIDRVNRFEDKQKKGVTDTRSEELIAREVHEQEERVRPYDFVVASSASSTWTIFSQIIGLSNYLESK